MNIQEYIESGILETYVMGSASDTEVTQLLLLKQKYPEIDEALTELEVDIEHIAQNMAVIPPPDMWTRISNNIDDLILSPPKAPLRVVPGREEREEHYKAPERERYIEVESESTHMRIHKSWKWIFAAVFVLGKIFLATAIYFYLENRQAQEQIQELKTELKQTHIIK